jgi:hypothetical protein
MLEWAAAEGWNPGVGDAQAFHAADPGGFLVGHRDREPVAAVSLVRYSRAFAFLGLYIVRPDQRGRGYGLAMWQAAMALARNATVGLDGVVGRQRDYARSGFRLVRRNIRYEGRGRTAAPAGVTDVAAVPRYALLAYDRTVFPAERNTFLGHWLPPAGGVAFAVAEQGIRGYGAIRPCRVGWKVGPLFADDADVASRLFAGLAGVAGDAPLYLDVPEPNGAAVALAERAGMAPVFETARMYRGTPPPEPVEQIFGVTTFELG